MAIKTDPYRTSCREPLDFARDRQRRTACHEHSRTACIVALLPGGVADRLSPDMVRVGSGYEAAAELLSGPVSSLLVDLAALPGSHAGLLKLAAGLDVPVVAFGTVSAALDGSALAGVRLVGVEDVPEILREIMTAKPANKFPTGQFVAEESPPPIQFDDAHRRQFDAAHCKQVDKPLTKDELDALLRD